MPESLDRNTFSIRSESRAAQPLFQLSLDPYSFIASRWRLRRLQLSLIRTRNLFTSPDSFKLDTSPDIGVPGPPTPLNGQVPHAYATRQGTPAGATQVLGTGCSVFDTAARVLDTVRRVLDTSVNPTRSILGTSSPISVNFTHISCQMSSRLWFSSTVTHASGFIARF